MTLKKLFTNRAKAIMTKVLLHNKTRETTLNSNNKGATTWTIETGTWLVIKDTKAPLDILDQTLITSLPRITYWGIALGITLGITISQDLIREGQVHRSLRRRATANSQSK
jgi:hypothetical protein